MRIFETQIKEIEHYKGSLDFPCDVCKANSYDNIHFKINGSLYFVVCMECLKIINESDKN